MADMFQHAGILFIGFFALVMLLVGVILVSLGLFTLQRHKAAAGWPRVPGVIESSEVAAKPCFKNNLMYRPVIRYRYGAPGGPYAGEKIANTDKLYAREKEARKISVRYSVGSTVMVRYNPADPSEALLERGAFGGIGLVCFGLLCWIFPLAAGIAAKFPWQIMAAILASLVGAFTMLMLMSGSSLARARSRGLLPPAGSCSDADVMELITRNEKLMAIRLYRELHGADLKEAREAIERLRRETRTSIPAT